MKPKTKAFADRLLNDPKTNATQAYIDTHLTTNRDSAKVSAHQLLTKPNVQIYMEEHIRKAKRRIVDLVDSDKEEIAFKASEAILDRELGKATQRIEQHTTGVVLTIDLTSSIDTKQ